MGYGGLGQPPVPTVDSPMIAGPQPGMVFIKGINQWVDMKTWTQEPIYDTELITTPVTAGDEYIFFRDAAFPTGVRKDLRHTNMTSQQQLPSGWNATVYLMTVKILFIETAAGSGLFTTPEDALRLYYNGIASFRTGEQRVEKECPLIFWPSPLGLTADVTRTGAGFTTFGTVNNGVPSLSATVPLELPITLSNELTFRGRVRFPGPLTLDLDTQIQFCLHTYMSKPLR